MKMRLIVSLMIIAGGFGGLRALDCDESKFAPRVVWEGPKNKELSALVHNLKDGKLVESTAGGFYKFYSEPDYFSAHAQALIGQLMQVSERASRCAQKEREAECYLRNYQGYSRAKKSIYCLKAAYYNRFEIRSTRGKLSAALGELRVKNGQLDAQLRVDKVPEAARNCFFEYASRGQFLSRPVWERELNPESIEIGI